MPIPNADQAILAAEKVRDYLLNLEHPDGGSKAVWFIRLATPAISGKSWRTTYWPLRVIAANSIPKQRASA